MKFKLICCNCGHDDFWINPLEVDKIDNTYTLVKCKNCGILERIHGLTVKVVRDKKGE